MPDATIHLRPTAPLAERVLLPGDPGRALLLAQALIGEPRMFNHHRGLWGYTGAAVSDGELLTIQSSGMGGPSAAIVVEELARLGARRVIRVGTCGAIAPGIDLGDVLVVRAALTADGTSRALGAGDRVDPDAALADALARAAGDRAREGLVASTDLFYDSDRGREATWVAAGALAVEMEAATVLRVASLRGLRAACALAVTDLIGPDGRHDRLGEDAIEDAGERVGRIAAAALGAADAPGPG
ncbi:MAG: hypothetical protein U0T02_10670 [Solirubrobacteraceae bacterium]